MVVNLEKSFSMKYYAESRESKDLQWVQYKALVGGAGGSAPADF
jgi:hypothetical protein